MKKKISLFKEKRKHPRIQYNAAITPFYCITTLESKKTKGRIKDLSSGGVKVTTSSRLSEGDLVAFSIALPGSNKLELVEGRVKWVKRIKKTYLVGIQFEKIGVIDKAHLRNFIDKKLHTSGVIFK